MLPLLLWLQITDAVVVAYIMNATLVVPTLDKNSFWKDSRSVFTFYLYKTYVKSIFCFSSKTSSLSCFFLVYMWYVMSCSNFADIFDVNWFISFLRDDVRIIKKLSNEEGKSVTPYSMRVPRKCTPDCYENRVLPQLIKRRVSEICLISYSIIYLLYFLIILTSITAPSYTLI